MSSGPAFFLLLAGTILWIALPFLPAVAELFSPRDAAPLEDVGRDAGPLTYFADSFRRVVDRDGYARAGAEDARLPDGRRVAVVADVAPATLADDVGLLVCAHRGAVPDQSTVPVETYGAGDLVLGEGVAARAVYAAGSLTCGEQLVTYRWLHAENDATIGSGSRLAGRATSRGTLRLGTGCQFDRLQAPRIAVGGAADRATGSTGEATREVAVTMPIFEPRGSGVRLMAAQQWRVDGDLTIPANHRVYGVLVVRGTIRVGEGCDVRGSLKAHEDVLIAPGAVVAGTVAAREDVSIADGAEVHGTVIAEGDVVVGPGARVGKFAAPTSIAADHVALRDGAIVYGAVSARRGGQTAG